MRGPAIAFYDGHCGICRAAYDKAAPRSRPGLRWVANASEEGLRLLGERGLLATSDDTLIVLERPGEPAERVYLRSAAVVQVAKRLRMPFSLLAPLVWLVPKPLREAQYRRIAAARSRDCKLPQRAV